MANQNTLQNEDTGQIENPVGKGTYTFPLNFEADASNVLIITEYEYSRTTIGDDPQKIPTDYNVVLPLPPSLQNNYTANWDTMELGGYGARTSRAMAEGVRAVTGGGNPLANIKSQLTKALTMNTSDIEAFMGDVSNALSGAGKDIIAGSAVSVFKKTTNALGIARNPFLAATYSGSNFRSFNFNYKFIPKSFEETQAIKNIIHVLKRGMHPDLVEHWENNLFKYPNMYELKFVTGKSEDGKTHMENPFLFKTGMCVIRDIGTDYHGEGIPAYIRHEDTVAPASISFTITFQEVEINTKREIDKGR